MSDSMRAVFSQIRYLLKVTADNILDLMSSECCRLCRTPVDVDVAVNGNGDPDYRFDLHETQLPPLARTLCPVCFHNLIKSEPFAEYLPGRRDLLPLAIAVPYEGKVRELIHKLKYERDQRIATDLASLLRNALLKLYYSCPPPDTILVSVPLSRKRQLSRGYNQVDLIARELNRTTGIGWSTRALKRIRDTRAQHDLSREERMENVRNAFTGDPQVVLGRNIILLDDVVTSGATITEAAEALLEAGATSVFALAVSRAQIEYRPLNASQERSATIPARLL